MDITEHGKSTVQNGADAVQEASDRLQRAAARAADRTQDAAQHAWRSARHAGREVEGFVYRRPVETALIAAGAACVITALAFWFTRPD